VQFNEMTGLL